MLSFIVKLSSNLHEGAGTMDAKQEAQLFCHGLMFANITAKEAYDRYFAPDATLRRRQTCWPIDRRRNRRSLGLDGSSLEREKLSRRRRLGGGFSLLIT